MSETYKAIEVRKPGEFAEVRRPLQDPGHDQVRIRVEACGVCHSDAATVEGGFPGVTYPRVPGHEVVGRIDAVASGVRGWQVGQRLASAFSPALPTKSNWRTSSAPIISSTVPQPTPAPLCSNSVAQR